MCQAGDVMRGACSAGVRWEAARTAEVGSWQEVGREAAPKVEAG